MLISAKKCALVPKGRNIKKGIYNKTYKISYKIKLKSEVQL